MSLLIDRFREELSKSKDIRLKAEAEFDVGYPTGFMPFDFKNGYIINVNDKENNKQFSYYSIGIVDGSINTCIGRSGSGKTTWALQSVANIIRPFPEAYACFDSLEGGVTRTRMETITGFKGKELKDRFSQRNTGVTAENFYEKIKEIYNFKIENKSELTYDTGFLDTEGNPIYKLIPTPYIIDSLSLLMPEKYTQEDELSGQMSATAAAKTNSSIFKRLTQMIKTVNIIIFVINHITEDVSINPMMKKKAQVSYLKMGETLPGGRIPVYLSNNIIRFDDHTKFKEEEGFRVTGNLVDLALVKSRSNKAGQSSTLVFNQDQGFDPELSLFILLKDAKKVNGAGIGMYLADRNDMKFSQKNLKDKLRNDMEFRELFMRECLIILKESIKPIDMKELEDYRNTVNISGMILEELNKELL